MNRIYLLFALISGLGVASANAADVVYRSLIFVSDPRFCGSDYKAIVFSTATSAARGQKYVWLSNYPEYGVTTSGLIQIETQEVAFIYGTNAKRIKQDVEDLSWAAEQDTRMASLDRYIRDARRDGLDAELVRIPSELVACFEGHT